MRQPLGSSAGWRLAQGGVVGEHAALSAHQTCPAGARAAASAETAPQSTSVRVQEAQTSATSAPAAFAQSQSWTGTLSHPAVFGKSPGLLGGGSEQPSASSACRKGQTSPGTTQGSRQSRPRPTGLMCPSLGNTPRDRCPRTHHTVGKQLRPCQLVPCLPGTYRATTRNWSICLSTSGLRASHTLVSSLDWSRPSSSPAEKGCRGVRPPGPREEPRGSSESSGPRGPLRAWPTGVRGGAPPSAGRERVSESGAGTQHACVHTQRSTRKRIHRHTCTHTCTQTQARTHRNAGTHTWTRSGQRSRASMAQGAPSPLEWGPGLAPRPLEEPPGGAAAQPLGEGGRFGYGRSSSLPRAATGSGATAPGPPCQPLTTSALMLAQHRHSPATRGPEAGGLVSGRLLPQPVGGTGQPRARPWTLLSWAAPVPRAGVLWSAVGMGPRGGPAERPPGVAGLAWRTRHTHIQLGHPS